MVLLTRTGIESPSCDRVSSSCPGPQCASSSHPSFRRIAANAFHFFSSQYRPFHGAVVTNAILRELFDGEPKCLIHGPATLFARTPKALDNARLFSHYLMA